MRRAAYRLAWLAGAAVVCVVWRTTGILHAVKVIEGTVECTAKATGETQQVNAGEMLSATADGFGEKETLYAEAEQARWDSLMKEAGLKEHHAGSRFGS
jgi:head-tail adaptor